MARRKNPNLIFVPNIKYYEVKNPKTLFPVNFEELYDEDKVRYEYEPIYDEVGNYLGTKKNVYVIESKVMGFKIFKKINVKDKEEEQEKFKKLKPKALF